MNRFSSNKEDEPALPRNLQRRTIYIYPACNALLFLLLSLLLFSLVLLQRLELAFKPPAMGE
jgi:hypothetical protein